jgi:hypothetical protein
MSNKIVIPYTPRPIQHQLHFNRPRHTVLVCHRRFGKTVFGVNELIRQAVSAEMHNPRVHYIAPQLKQAKRVAWDYVLDYTRNIPGREVNIAELRVDFPITSTSTARIQLYGSENPDSIRGAYSDFVVLDEYAQCDPRLLDEVVLPMLMDRKGGSIIMGTPMGPNHFYDLFEAANSAELREVGWGRFLYRASETGIMDPLEIKAAQRRMSPAQFAQEMECSFTSAIPGAYYAEIISTLEQKGQITEVSYDPNYPLEAWFDLGVSDATAIWIVQRDTPGGPRILAAGQAMNLGIPDYIDLAKELAPATINRWVAPFDMKVREQSLAGAPTRQEVARNFGVDFEVLDRLSVQEGIEMVRRFLPSAIFNAKTTKEGRNALMSYRSEWDGKHQTLKLRPVHDWSSHFADAFRYGAQAGPATQARAQEAWAKYAAKMGQGNTYAA